MKPLSSKRFVTLALAVTLVAAYFAPDPQSGDQLYPPIRSDAVAETISAEAADGTNGQQVMLLLPRSPLDWRDPGIDVFAADSSASLPQSSVAPPMDPAPSEASGPRGDASKLDLRVLGRYDDGARMQVFVSIDDRNIAVGEGDSIGDSYRVERIDAKALIVRDVRNGHRQHIAMELAP